MSNFSGIRGTFRSSIKFLMMAVLASIPFLHAGGIHLEDTPALGVINKGFDVILDCNGEGTGRRQRIVKEWLDEFKGQTVPLRDSQFILLEHVPPLWLYSSNQQQSPIGETDFKRSFDRYWYRAFEDNEPDELTITLVYVLSKYVSKFGAEWEDRRFRQRFTKLVASFKEKNSKKKLWVIEERSEGLFVVLLGVRDFPNVR